MLDKIIQKRRSVRKFKSKTPDWRDILVAIDAATYAPMAGDIFTLRIMVVDEQNKINEIAKWAEQEFVADTKYVVVFTSNPKRTTNHYGKRGVIYVRQQAGAAIQNFLLKLTELGLATCWVGHFNEERIKQLLKIPEDRDIEAVFPIGYEGPRATMKKTKKDLYNLLYFNKWGERRMKKEGGVNV